MTRLLCCLLLTGVASTSFAHFPDHKNKPVTPIIDVIGPIGNCLPMGHRRRYNRPSKVGGWLAYVFEPSSQEAMTWHAAAHRGNYKKKTPRTEMRYFYPKPWEALQIGPRIPDGDLVPATDVEEIGTPTESRYGSNLPDSVIDVLELSEQAAE